MYTKYLIYNNLKRYYLACLLALFISSTFAQSNFYKLSAGGGFGGTYSFTDVQKGAYSMAGYANLDYYFTPFITAGLELQTGLVKGGNRITDPHSREFTNGFMSFALNTKFRAGEFTNFYYNEFLNYTKGFYLGTGIGMIQNNMNSIVRTKINPNGSIYTFPGDDKSTNIVLPINVGIDFYFPDGWGEIRYMINLNYQTNFVFGEGLDGYNDPKTIFKNSSPDLYNFLSVGFKYTFGSVGLTSKNLR